uniref:Uncharacterized protein n=1 Tax=Avena sativa TaxID=4498 RepID=A0ACD6A3L3_AVESA
MDVAVNIPSDVDDDRTSMVPRKSPFKTAPVVHDDTAKQLPRHSILVKKSLAEFLGTFLLIFILLSALIMNATHDGALGLVGVSATAGLAVLVIVASLVHVSGAHLNPAISVAMALFGYLPRAHLAPYVAAQFLGATAASFLAKAIYRPNNLGAIVATVPTLGTAETFFVEFLITFVLLLVIAAHAVDPKAVRRTSTIQSKFLRLYLHPSS